MDDTQVDVLYALVAAIKEAAKQGAVDSVNRLCWSIECVLSNCAIEDEKHA